MVFLVCLILISLVLQLYYAKHEDKQEGKDPKKYQRRVIDMTRELLAKVDPNGMKVRAVRDLLALARGQKPVSNSKKGTAIIRERLIPEYSSDSSIPILPVVAARFIGKAHV